MRPSATGAALLTLIAAVAATAGDIPEEFRIDREQVFEFATPPAVTRDGDRVTITFESKGFCDATVAVEDAGGRIVRHLASGVLGPNAPAPFAKDSKKQALTWDGKDDRGEYVIDSGMMTVRVSLGLRPRLERSLQWTPKRRISGMPPLLAAAGEGVYVYQGAGLDNIRLFGHAGDYVRTVYPFPASKIAQVRGLEWIKLPQLDQKVPLKRNAYKNTFFTCGPNGGHALSDQSKNGLTGNAASALTVGDSRVAVVGYSLNRVSTDGTSGELDFNGPDVFASAPSKSEARVVRGARYDAKVGAYQVMPRSAALSPDGKWLYLTAYQWTAVPNDYFASRMNSLHGVMRLRYDGDKAAELFLGRMDEAGEGVGRFSAPTSVDCDAAGRIYVADYLNDRVQVFSPAGDHLQTITAHRPSKVRLNRESGELYVFSWMIPMAHHRDRRIDPILQRFSAWPDFRKLKSWPLPGVSPKSPSADTYAGWGRLTEAEIDLHAATPTVWLSQESAVADVFVNTSRDRPSRWRHIGPRLFSIVDDELVEQRNFVQDALKVTPGLRPPVKFSQYLVVNPKTGRLFVAAATGRRGGAERTNALLEIDPESGQHRSVEPPLNPADLAFDFDGQAYLRIRDVIVRYDPETWREVPWDYGEEREFDGVKIAAGLPVPLNGWWIWQGGLSVSARGEIVAHYPWRPKLPSRRDKDVAPAPLANTLRLYPGRPVSFGVSIWDRHGKLAVRDALPGIGKVSGIALDSDRNITVMADGLRMWDSKPYAIASTGTLLQVSAGKARLLTSSRQVPLPLPVESRPDRSPEMRQLWIEGARWLYGGVGYNNSGIIHCFCWHTRFCQDWFGRSFVPEPDIFGVAVLDTNGNLLLRIGRYGNVDDGAPLVKAGGPADPAALGGDEVSLFQPNFVAAGDRRLFIADPGNARIVSVKLDYHRSRSLPVPGG